MRTILLIGSLLCLPFFIKAQLTGQVTEKGGQPLPFASVFLQNSTKGTSTNENGEYKLALEPGQYQVVFQYIGFRTVVREVSIGAEPVRLHISMEEEGLFLREVQITASEDPAYEVIRNAMGKRKYYRDLLPAFQCKTYIKGQFKMLESPTRIFGEEIGDMDGLLDSTGKGLVYLSESESILNRQEPDGYKEIMISSRVSGEDRGFSFNSALALSFSFYENTLDLAGRGIVSPIASNAMSYYRFRMEGTFYDERGRLINRIRVIPKRKTDPVFAGEIYIIEGLWNIHSLDLTMTGSNIQNPILDTLRLQQVNLHVKEDIWVPFQKTLSIDLKLLGFHIGGGFTGVFREYDIAPDFPKSFFNREIFKVERGSNDKGVSYWDTIRPIPLTLEESVDYRRRDSLELERKKDSTYVSESFGLFSGFERSNSFRNRRLQIGSPLTSFQFNTVQGLHLWMDASYSFDAMKEKETGRHNRHRLRGQVNYGFAEKEWRGDIGYRLHFADYWSNMIYLDMGRYVSQYNEIRPIRPHANSFYSLFYKQNYLKLFEWDKIQVGWQREWFNGFYAHLRTGLSRRKALTNHTDYSLGKKERSYLSNNPLMPDDDMLAFESHRHHFVQVYLQYTPANRYMSFPGRKIDAGSPLPTFRLKYQQGLPISGGDTDYRFLSMGADDSYNWGVLGQGAWRMQAGFFLKSKSLYFMDYRHFDGNQTIFGDPAIYMRSFHLLPYYQRSTTETYWEFHYQHAFNGFILDKLPLFRKLGFRSVAGIKSLVVDGSEHYAELSFGLDNVGVSGARFLRIDAVWQFVDGSYSDFGIMIGMELFAALLGDGGRSDRTITVGL